MDDAPDHALPSYERGGGAPSYEHAPSYDAAPRAGSTPAASTSPGPTLTLDPTGMFIREIPSTDAPPLYTLNNSLLHVGLGSSVQVERSVRQGDQVTSVPVYTIGDRYISPLLSRKAMLQNISVARTSGIFAMAHLREIVWDFLTYVVPAKPQGEGAQAKKDYHPPTADGFLIGLTTDTRAVQRHLLRFYGGKCVGEDDEVLALERDGGVECGGMPVLSLTRTLDQEKMDLLVSAWCVTMWGQVGKRARRLSEASGRKLSIGKFKLGSS